MTYKSLIAALFTTVVVIALGLSNAQIVYAYVFDEAVPTNGYRIENEGGRK